MCILCTVDRHWANVYFVLKNKYPLTTDEVRNLPNDIKDKIAEVEEHSVSNNVDLIVALKDVFFKQHILTDCNKSEQQKTSYHQLITLWDRIETMNS